MKNKMIKKITANLMIALMLIVVCACFAACTDPKKDGAATALEGKATIVVFNPDTQTASEIEVDFGDAQMKTDNSLLDLLAWLDQNDRLTFAYSVGAYGYGVYLTAIGDIATNDGKYVYVYTSVESDFDMSAYVSEVTYQNTTLKSSGVGVSSMQLRDGAIYYFTLI